MFFCWIFPQVSAKVKQKLPHSITKTPNFKQS